MFISFNIFFLSLFFRFYILSAGRQEHFTKLYKNHHQPSAVGPLKQHPPGYQDLSQGEKASS